MMAKPGHGLQRLLGGRALASQWCRHWYCPRSISTLVRTRWGAGSAGCCRRRCFYRGGVLLKLVVPRLALAFRPAVAPLGLRGPTGKRGGWHPIMRELIEPEISVY